MTFEWDAEKARTNEIKHGVSFEEAKTVFNDPFSITIADPNHHEEERWLDIGLSDSDRLLVVWYTEHTDRIRIIGCRGATKTERQYYEHSEF